MRRAQNTVKRGSFWRPGVSAAGAAAPLSYGEERTAVRQGHGQGAPDRIKGCRPLPPPAADPWATVPFGIPKTVQIVVFLKTVHDPTFPDYLEVQINGDFPLKKHPKFHNMVGQSRRREISSGHSAVAACERQRAGGLIRPTCWCRHVIAKISSYTWM